MTEGLTQAALAAEPLLRRLADGRPIGKPADLAREFGRDENNTRRTIRNLRDEGFIAQDELALTDRADRALKAMDFAAGVWSPDAPTGPVIDVYQFDLSPHPHNPRKHVDDEEVQALACAIDAAGRILNPLRVTPPDGAGHRYILAGQRRWLANGILIEDGRKGRREPLPAIEQDVTETADVILLGMQENTGAPLSEIDDARALAFLCETKGWSAAECARQTGRLVKTVQDRLKILSRATPEDLAAVERGEMKYSDLRTAVGERRLPAEAPPELDLDDPPDDADERDAAEEAHLPAPQSGEGGPSDASPMVEGAQGEDFIAAISDLAPDEHVAMVEVCHLLATEGSLIGGRPFKSIKIGAFHQDPLARGLIIQRRLIQVFQPSGSEWRAFLSPAGEEWLKWNTADWSDYRNVVAARAEFEINPDGRFATPWLNPAPPKVRDGMTGDAFSRQLAEVTADAESEPGSQAREDVELFMLTMAEGRIIVELFLALRPEQLTDIAGSLSLPEADLEGFNRRVAAWVEP